MALTIEERQAFGQFLRQERKRAGLSAAQVAEQLTAAGMEFTGASVSGWERGEFVPKSAGVVIALEAILHIEDARLQRFWGGGGVNWRAKMDEYDQRLEMLERRLAEQLGPEKAAEFMRGTRGDLALAADAEPGSKPARGRQRKRPSPDPEPESG